MMARQHLIRTARSASRALQATRAVGIAALGPARLPMSRPTFSPTTSSRPFTTDTPRLGITPDNLPAKEAETPDLVRTPANITDAEYHSVADEFMDRLLSQLEGLEEKTEDLDVEYSVCTPTPQYLLFPSPLTTPHLPGRRPQHSLWARDWHLRRQQAATQQADLAVVAQVGSQAL